MLLNGVGEQNIAYVMVMTPVVVASGCWVVSLGLFAN